MAIPTVRFLETDNIPTIVDKLNQTFEEISLIGGGPRGPVGPPGAAGIIGPPGTSGEQGLPGEDGTEWFVETNDPSLPPDQIGGTSNADFYHFNVSTGKISRWDENNMVWIEVGTYSSSSGFLALNTNNRSNYWLTAKVTNTRMVLHNIIDSNLLPEDISNESPKSTLGSTSSEQILPFRKTLLGSAIPSGGIVNLNASTFKLQLSNLSEVSGTIASGDAPMILYVHPEGYGTQNGNPDDLCAEFGSYIQKVSTNNFRFKYTHDININQLRGYEFVGDYFYLTNQNAMSVKIEMDGADTKIGIGDFSSIPINANLHVRGNAQINGNLTSDELTVNNLATFNNVNITDTLTANELEVEDSITINTGNLDINTGNLTVGNDALINNDMRVNNVLRVDGAVTFSDTLNVNDNTVVQGNFTVTGDDNTLILNIRSDNNFMTLNPSDLVIDSELTLRSSMRVVNPNNNQNNFTLSNGGQYKSTGNIELVRGLISGTTTITLDSTSGNITSTGDISSNDMTVNGNLAALNTVNVRGNTNIYQDLRLSGSISPLTSTYPNVTLGRIINVPNLTSGNQNNNVVSSNNRFAIYSNTTSDTWDEISISRNQITFYDATTTGFIDFNTPYTIELIDDEDWYNKIFYKELSDGIFLMKFNLYFDTNTLTNFTKINRIAVIFDPPIILKSVTAPILFTSTRNSNDIRNSNWNPYANATDEYNGTLFVQKNAGPHIGRMHYNENAGNTTLGRQELDLFFDKNNIEIGDNKEIFLSGQTLL